MTSIAGAGQVVALVARRDKVRIAAWVAGILVLVVATAASTKGIYATQASLDSAAAMDVANPVALAFNGPAQALDTIGGQIAFQIGAFGLIVVGLMTLLLLGRLTRSEEDSGRLEMVRAMPVGPHAPLTAALVVVVAVELVVAVTVALALVSQDLPALGSIVFGASYFAFGLAFIGITAVSAQVAENPRVAMGTAGAVLGLAFVLRAIGDTGPEWLSWLSPIGIAQRSRPYAGERWWPLLILVVLGVGLIVLAFRLSDRRDFGAGMVAPSAGPARAAAGLSSPFGLAFRLHRAAIVWWILSVVVLAVVYGTLATSIDDFVRDSPGIEDVIASFGSASLTDSYLATSLLIVSLLAAGPALQIAVRLRSEETAQRTEVIIATPVSRQQWVMSHYGTAIGAGALAVVTGGAAVGAGYALTGGGLHQVPRLLVASLVYIPAVSLLTSIAMLLFGVAPRATAGAWISLGVCFTVAMFGALLKWPQWVLDVSPFQHTPAVPADPVRAVPLTVLTALAVACSAAGMAGFRRRDLATV